MPETPTVLGRPNPRHRDRPEPTPGSWPAWTERRDSPRVTPLEFRAWLGWWDGQDFRAEAVRLLDISQGGAMIEMLGPPPEAQDLWFRLARPEAPDCVGATAVRFELSSKGAYRVGLAFEGRCPGRLYWFAVTAVDGPTSPE